MWIPEPGLSLVKAGAYRSSPETSLRFPFSLTLVHSISKIKGIFLPPLCPHHHLPITVQVFPLLPGPCNSLLAMLPVPPPTHPGCFWWQPEGRKPLHGAAVGAQSGNDALCRGVLQGWQSRMQGGKARGGRSRQKDLGICMAAEA